MNVSDAKKWFRLYYSQNREDLILEAFFYDIDKGFYVDVGAHDPKIFSVTKLFYDRGWSGINIEPQKSYSIKLSRARKRDINLNIALGSKKSNAIFREYLEADGLSTMSTDIMMDYQKDKVFSRVTKKYRDYTVPMETLESILDVHAKDKEINFLKIDVEGLEKEVILGNNWHKFRPQVLCIESNHELNNWHKLLDLADYNKFFFDGLNEYFIAKEHYVSLSNKFDYVSSALSKISINSIPFEMFANQMLKMEKELKKLNAIIKNQENHTQRLRQITQKQQSLIDDYQKVIDKQRIELNGVVYKIIKKMKIKKA